MSGGNYRENRLHLITRVPPVFIPVASHKIRLKSPDKPHRVEPPTANPRLGSEVAKRLQSRSIEIGKRTSKVLKGVKRGRLNTRGISGWRHGGVPLASLILNRSRDLVEGVDGAFQGDKWRS